MIKIEKFIQKGFENSEEWAKVCVVADSLVTHLNQPLVPSQRCTGELF